MKKIITALFIVGVLSVFGFAQNNLKADASLEAAMTKFKNSIVKKQTSVFLSFISRTDGLTMMNTIDQGEAGNVDKPMFDSKLTYAALAADFKKKGENYRSIFVKSPDSPNFYDALTSYKGAWTLGADNKFMPLDPADKTPVREVYVKWKKEGNRWYAVEVGRMIS